LRETEARNSAGPLDALPALELVRLMHAEDRRAAEAVGGALEEVARVVEAAVRALSSGGRLVYVGAGTSGRLGALDAAECGPTFGVEPGRIVALVAGGARAFDEPDEGAEDDVAAGRREIEAMGVGRSDLVVGISASGRTPYTLEALRAAGERGAATACVVNASGSEMARAAGIAVEVPTGAEVLAGSTRLKAGTAQKMVLNMISTGAMSGLGHVYENLMVGVVAHNEKLKARARGIVREISGRTEGEARDALERSGYDARIAVLLLDGVPSAEETRRRLERAGGSLRRAREGG